MNTYSFRLRAAACAALMMSAVAIILGGCGQPERYKPDPYYLSGAEADREKLESLFVLLHSAEGDEERFSLSREIASVYMRRKNYPLLNNFLASRVDADEDSPYNAYYLLMTAYSHTVREAPEVAELYFELILNSYPDMLYEGKSIHLACLNQLLDIVDEPTRRVGYYRELITRFSDEIDKPAALFFLGQGYERVGEWNLALQSYAEFTDIARTVSVTVPGFSNAEQYASRLVAFNNSSKDWTFESLDSLVGTVRSAIADGDAWRLWGYRAKVNFFARSWSETESDDFGMADFSLPQFMQGGAVRCAAELDPNSNATEAYLRTWGWSQGISTWYLYFRKIYFPPNPDIHGRWEWAGVYYGERF
jgi:tetratricopeptide (TPR) repeat protein